MLYSSIENPKIKELKKLHQKKYRDKTQTFLVEGKHLILEAYKNKQLKEVLVLENKNISLDIKTNYMTKNIQKYLSTLETPTDFIGICQKKENQIIGKKILLLDELQDPGNLGTIIRSAVAFNVSTIILSPTCADVYSPKVLRASQGLIFHINIIITDLAKIIPHLKQKGYQILGTNVSSGKDIKTLEKKQKFAIIMGNEGKGIKKNLLELCDEYIHINMKNTCESLNVAVASSIILYELDK